MSHSDEGHCQACEGDFCTAKVGCVALSNDYEVSCARCGKVGMASTFMVEEGDEWECPPCWERCEAEDRKRKAWQHLREQLTSGKIHFPCRWGN